MSCQGETKNKFFLTLRDAGHTAMERVRHDRIAQTAMAMAPYLLITSFSRTNWIYVRLTSIGSHAVFARVASMTSLDGIVLIFTLVMALAIGVFCSMSSVDRFIRWFRGFFGIDHTSLRSLVALSVGLTIHLGLAMACAYWLVTTVFILFI